MRLLILTLMVISSSLFSMEAPKFGGDIRYRVDRTDEEGRDVRARHRIRGRISMKGKVSEKLSYGFRLSSGDSGSPTSTNTTLDGAFSTKEIYFDRIYIKYQLCEYTKLVAGKMKNPFYRVGKNHMVFDGDVAPEGLALAMERDFLFVNLSYFVVEERSDSSDTTMAGAQAGLKFALKNAQVKIGGSFYGYMGIKGRDPLYDSTKAYGNSLSGGKYANDYDIAEFFWSIKFGALELYADYINNVAADSKNDGSILGATYRGEKWVGFYNFREVGADANLGVFADSDFSGGGTDNKGHMIGVGYFLSKQSRLSLTHFYGKTRKVGDYDYQRTFFDYKMYF